MEGLQPAALELGRIGGTLYGMARDFGLSTVIALDPDLKDWDYDTFSAASRTGRNWKRSAIITILTEADLTISSICSTMGLMTVIILFPMKKRGRCILTVTGSAGSWKWRKSTLPVKRMYWSAVP